MKFLECAEKLAADLDKVRFDADRLLEHEGWKKTCDVPGCFWLWGKKLSDGRTILTESKLAYEIQKNLSFDDKIKGGAS